MIGSSRASLAAARDAVVQLVDGRPAEELTTLGDELLAASTSLGGSAALRGALADSGTPSEARASLVRTVFGGKLGALTLDVLAEVAGRRWTTSSDLVDSVEALGAEAYFVVAERAGRLDTVEDALFRIDRLVAGDDELRRALTDPAVDDEAKAQLLGGLLEGKVTPETVTIVSHVVRHPRGRRLDAALGELVQQSARRRQKVVANVKVAAALTAGQHERLTAALARIYRHEVDLQVEVVPEIQGGVVVRVGDDVIDGSIANRIDDIRRRLTL